MIDGIKAAIFDMDGTLLDSLSVWDRVIAEFFGRVNMVPSKTFLDRVGHMSLREGAALLKESCGLDATVDRVIEEINERVARFYEYEVEAKPGVREYLTGMRSAGVRMCVATESCRKLAEAALGRLGLLDFFEFVLSCQENCTGKNTPGVYLEAAKRLGAAPGECMVYEDALYALTTARNAGFATAAVFEPHESRQDEMKRLADLYLEW